jgi:hypothetical protein
MTSDEFAREHHTQTKDESSFGYGGRLEKLPADTHLWVYHATDDHTAKKFVDHGLRPGEKPGNIQADRYERGEHAEFSPGHGLGRGTYVGSSPHDVEGYGRHVVAMRVKRSQLSPSPEFEHIDNGYLKKKGARDLGGHALGSNDALVHHDIEPHDIVSLGSRSLYPESTHKEFVKHALRHGKPVPDHVLAEYPKLDAWKGVRRIPE